MMLLVFLPADFFFLVEFETMKSTLAVGLKLNFSLV